MAPAKTASLGGTAFLSWSADGRVRVADRGGFVKDGIDGLVRDATFGSGDAQANARYLIWEGAHELGIVSSSIHDLYVARGQGKVRGFTVPAINIRGPTYDVARAALRAAKKSNVGGLIFELAKSEMEYTQQPPIEYATSILAAAIKEEWNQPIFVQGDHFQFSAKRYAADPAKETQGLRSLVEDAIAGGFHNIDIDASTLVDLSKPNVPAQQLVNSQLSADLTQLVREREPKGTTISVGGEIGEVGKENSTPDELRAYLDQYGAILHKKTPDAIGVSKVSVQTGTSHGGVVGKDGKVIAVEVDFETLAELSEICVKEYRLAGCVQHGASTLPDDLFHKFPDAGTAEIHLATGFQNAYFDHPAFPAELKKRIYAHLDQAHADEMSPKLTKEQFYYRTRKKAYGPFKRELWDLAPDVKKPLMDALERRFAFLFRELRVGGTRDAVAKHVRPVRVRRAAPKSLGSRP
ncbi:MAG TPA: class II fructose-bisphosphate aldolase [Candidatus Thermoplasmatota archaeon]|nr:class II fructose-bisphosphate aldolase [Candidatus Thermoplasmatota archaeon]